MLQLTVHNGGRVPVKSFPKNAEGGDALLDTRTGRAVNGTVVSGDGSYEADPADPYRFFVKPAAVSLAIGDLPRVTIFNIDGDRDLSEAGVDLLADTVELTHLPPDAPPPATDLGLAGEPEEGQPA